jgi:hypothetical protein
LTFAAERGVFLAAVANRVIEEAAPSSAIGWASQTDAPRCGRRGEARMVARPLVLSDAERRRLEHWLRAGTTPQRLVLRSRIVLALAEGSSGRETARALGISRHTVDLWRARFSEARCAALEHDRPGRGRRPRAIAAAEAGQANSKRPPT